MPSMIHARAFSPVIYQKIRVATDLYGVNCKVFNPINIPQGFGNYSDIQYSDTEFFNQKLLIPKAALVRSNNPFTEEVLSEEENILWSTIAIPRYSKVVVEEVSSLISFTISNIETTRDSRNSALDSTDPSKTKSAIYYKYTLVPSTSIPPSEDIALQEAIDLENIVDADPNFKASVESGNKIPVLPPSSDIKVGKL